MTESERERSAAHFADRINVPVLILQGGAAYEDWRDSSIRIASSFSRAPPWK